VLLTWCFLVWVLVFRWERVTAAPMGKLDEKVRFAVLALGLVAAWLWSFRVRGRSP
jgi:hypothetical protein